MSKPIKDMIVAEYKRLFGDIGNALIIDIRGIEANENNDLRVDLQNKDIHITVLKNSLAKTVVLSFRRIFELNAITVLFVFAFVLPLSYLEEPCLVICLRAFLDTRNSISKRTDNPFVLNSHVGALASKAFWTLVAPGGRSIGKSSCARSIANQHILFW